MARFYDQITKEGLLWPRTHSTSPVGINNAVVVEASNVASYYFEHEDYEGNEVWTLQDFPSIAPPFPITFFEFNAKVDDRLAAAFDKLGVLFLSIDLHAAGEHEIPVFVNGGEEYSVSEYGPERPDDARWLVEAFVITSRHKTDRPIVAVTEQYYLDDVGSVVKNRKGAPMSGAAYVEYDGWSAQDPYVYFGRTVVYPCLLATSFMHCKNVRLDENDPPEKPSRRRKKRHGKPLTKYYTLEIEPMRQTLRREGRSEEVGLKRSLHICRGHFATYSEEKPLFGKVAGTFWRDAHVRGRADQGMVAKDYSV